MKEQRTLTFFGDPEGFKSFFADMTPRLRDAGWDRDTAEEQHLQNRLGKSDVSPIIVIRAHAEEFKNNRINLMANSEGTEYQVTGLLTPREIKGVSLTLDQKNELIDAFYERFVKSFTQQNNIRVERSSEQFSIKDLIENERLPKNGYQLLKDVAREVEYYNGGFIEIRVEDAINELSIAAFREVQTKEIDGKLLRQVLIEEFAVNPELAQEVSSHHQKSVRLLKRYAVVAKEDIET